jgi:hypothetical protein
VRFNRTFVCFHDSSNTVGPISFTPGPRNTAFSLYLLEDDKPVFGFSEMNIKLLILARDPRAPYSDDMFFIG